jgi:hypothetical protein
MPVIINETEIVVEQPMAPAAPAPAAPASTARLTPEDVMRVVLRQQERVARIWAD